MNQARAITLQKLQSPFDVLVVGGGITGAAIALEAARCGLQVALIEQRDYAWGTSSRSSKLVHGGLRYLKEGQLHLTAESVKEREALKQEASGLIEPQSFFLAHYPHRKPGKWVFKLGLTVYDAIAGKRTHKSCDTRDTAYLAPYIDQQNLQGGMQYWDAKTDDARLVLRVLEEAQTAGAVTLNYCAANKLILQNNRVTGVEVSDVLTQEQFSIHAKVVISATGAWADELRQQLNVERKIRPLRGSHLLFPLWKIPVAQSVSFFHPHDGRPVFIYPWEGVALLGTTDLDHHAALSQEAAISGEETAYLLAALRYQFPDLSITAADIISSYAGVRPVIGSGQADPSKESRDHLVLNEQGLITITGGKLTTFRPIALDALQAVAKLLNQPISSKWRPIFNNEKYQSICLPLPESEKQRLISRYGPQLLQQFENIPNDEFGKMGASTIYWLEVRLAAQDHSVQHLDDLLLRRTRIGNVLKQGGKEWLPRIRAIAQPLLGWNDEKWLAEEQRYLQLWQTHYSVPSAIPDVALYLKPKVTH